MGSTTQTFVEIQSEKVLEIKRVLLDYVKTIRQSLEFVDGRPSNPPPIDDGLKMTDDGYPVLPISIELEHLNKASLVIILRTYLNTHYSE
jgi:hypothetical protein